MTIQININEETVVGLITELEAKGCYEVAEAIEKAVTEAKGGKQ